MTTPKKKTSSEAPLTEYYYPKHGVTVTASSLDEADKKLLSLIGVNDAKTNKRGDTSKSDE